jgi:hypothetical protein
MSLIRCRPAYRRSFGAGGAQPRAPPWQVIALPSAPILQIDAFSFTSLISGVAAMSSITPTSRWRRLGQLLGCPPVPVLLIELGLTALQVLRRQQSRSISTRRNSP